LIVPFLNQSLKNSFKPILGVFIAFFFIAFGAIITEKKNNTHSENHILHKQQVLAYSGVIDSEVEIKEKTIKFELKLNEIKNSYDWESAEGRVLIYIYKDSYHNHLKYGDKILISGTPDLILEPSNPEEFNLKRYYAFHGITHRHFISANKLQVFGYEPNSLFFTYAIWLRKKAENIFDIYFKNEREKKIASALILGIKGDIDEEIEQAYSATGTMHVLAVSGLHVGIILQILKLLFSFLQKFKHGKTIRSVILVICLWVYAFVTGLCPSVLRAVSMFTMLIVAENIHKNSTIFNSMAVSAFVLLCYNPYFITEVGFQLSFLAVGGIIYFQPKFYRFLEFESSIADWFWSVTCVSLAAQIATFPLGLLYFHQFPVYFLLSNLFVIPAAVGIMVVGLGFVLLSFWDFTGKYLGWLVEQMVWLLNQSILFIEQMPFSTLSGISISVLETWLIYGAVLTISLAFLLPNKYYLWAFFVFSFLFLGLQINENIIQNRQKRLIVYQISKGSLVDFINGKDCRYFGDDKIIENTQKMQFHVNNHRWSRGVNSIKPFNEIKEESIGKVLVWNGLKIFIIENSLKNIDVVNNISVDFILIKNNSLWDLTLLNNFKCKTIIFDGSNGYRNIEKISLQQIKYPYTIHFTAKSGAFVFDMP
jgi:competence protein ComEC